MAANLAGATGDQVGDLRSLALLVAGLDGTVWRPTAPVPPVTNTLNVRQGARTWFDHV
jgi:hypothetical protein